MTSEQLKFDHARRMYAQAIARLNDADILAQSTRTGSDSQQLLRILSFEIMLKCALRLCDQQPKATHKYTKLWGGLPGDVQQEILASAHERMPGIAELSDLDLLLNAYQFVFERARYYYELYEGFTLEEEFEAGRQWLDRGAPDEEARVRYFPAELDCLIHGLCLFIESRLARRDG